MAVKIIVTDKTGTQGRFLPMVNIDLDACVFSYRSDGGMTVGTLATFLPLAQAGHIQPGDRVDVECSDVLFWRGYIDDPSLSRPDAQTASFSVYGAWNYALRATAQQRYLRPGGVDVSVFFSNIIRGWVLPLFPSLVVQSDTVGVLKDKEDAWGRPVRDVLGELSDWAGADTVYGSDVVDSAFGDDPALSFGYGLDRLFLRQAKDPTAVGFVPDFAEFTPGPRGGTAGREIRSSEVVNALYFVGGPREFPNVFPSDMETPLAAGPASADAGKSLGNLLQDSGFESRDHWTLFGGSSYKTGGLSEGNAFAGNNMVETDNVGEGASQNHTGPGDTFQDIIPGHTYQFGGHVRQTQGADTNAGSVTLTWIDGNGDMPSPSTITVQPPSAGAWEFYTGTSVCPAGAIGWRVEFQMTAKGHDGLVWDEMQLFDQTLIYMDGVELSPFGDAVVVAQNWVVEGDAYLGLGAYTHVFQVTAEDEDGHDVQLHTRGSARAQCLGNQSLTFSVPLKLPAGAPPSPKLLLEVQFFDGSGKSVSSDKHTIDAGSVTADWQLFHTTEQAPSSAVYVTAWLTIRGNGTLEADAFCLRDSSTDVAGSPTYVPTGPLIERYRAADFPELSAAQRASEATYGYREPNQAYTSQAVTLDADAYQFALNLFKQKALPPERGPFEVIAPAKPIMPGMVGRLTGPDGPLLAGDARRVEECDLRFSRGIPVLSLTMEDARPDAARFLLDLALKRTTISSAAFASSAGGSSSNPIPIPGIGDDYFGELPHTTSDPTLHDDYREGPHVSDAERTQWDGTMAEVIAARTRTSTGVEYTSLELRLDAQDSASEVATAASFGTVKTDITQAGGSVVYTKTTADTLLAAKEPTLGDPATSGEILSSTAAGVRSWVALPAGFTPAPVAAPASVAFDHADYNGATELITWRALVTTSPASGAIEYFGWQTSPDNATWSTETFSGNTFQGPGLTAGSQYARCRAYPLVTSGTTPAPSGWVASAIQNYAAPATPSTAPTVVSTLPSASAATRNKFYVLQVSGAQDVLYYGVQNANGTYALVPLSYGAAVQGTGGGTATFSKADPNGYSTGLARWEFNETSGTTLSDSSGNGNTLTIHNSVTFGTDSQGNYLQLGSIAYAQGAGAALTGQGDFSLEWWVLTPNAWSGTQWLGAETSGVETANADVIYEAAINSAGEFGMWMGGSDGNEPSFYGTKVLTNAVVHHLMAVYTASTKTMQTYVDGVADASHTYSLARVASAGSNLVTVGPGTGREGSASYTPFSGRYYVHAIYARAVPASEVAARFNAY